LVYFLDALCFRFPHPASLFGLLNVGNVYIPINENWDLFLKNNDRTSEETKEAGARVLIEAARKVLDVLKPDEGDGVKVDAWFFDVDWSFKNGSEYPENYEHICKVISRNMNEFGDIQHSGKAYCFDEFLFYRLPHPSGNHFRMRHEHEKLFLKLNTYPQNVCFHFFLRNRFSKSSCCKYNHFKIGLRSYKDGTRMIDRLGENGFQQGAQNVGDPLGKHFLRYIESKVLRPTRHIDEFFVLLDAVKTTKFWTNYAKRFEAEIPMWYDSNDKSRVGAIAPAIIPAGTVSRRSVHKLWVTLTNESGNDRIGTGIKALVQAPSGSVLVGADVDSQEQWLAGLFGDASHATESYRRPGLTPFSNMMLAGSKADGTDLHSVVANRLKIDRNSAKVLNYARMYGAGEAHATKYLSQTGMNEKQAMQTAKDLFKITKGSERNWKMLRREVNPLFLKFICGLKDGEPHDYLTVDGYFYIPSYDSDLSESATFNYLGMKTHCDVLRTPVLDCRLSDALSALPPETPDRLHFASKYKRSVMNWIVQSSAVDFLHLLLVCMEWLTTEYEIPARFVISIHDEVRYLCPEKDAPRLALALMLSNMYVRSFISSKLGIEQLPSSVAFFSQVDCDTVLRKEVHIPCFNPDGTQVPDGGSANNQIYLAVSTEVIHRCLMDDRRRS
uniref:DNA-directed DNA polymerase n=1 Tax=Angiostrongylus costaricensis TaxID=334426 RepID=A0A158PMK0_ANGCS